MAPQGHVFPITLQVQASQKYTNRYPANPDYCCPRLDAGRASETCPVVPLEFPVVLLQNKESNRTTSFGQIQTSHPENDYITQLQLALLLISINLW